LDYPVLVSSLYSSDIETIFRMVKEVLEQDAVCQKDPDLQKDDILPEELPEEDSMLISAAGDVVAALATALGEQFVEPFQGFLPLIIKYYVSLHLFINLYYFINSCIEPRKDYY